MSKLNAMMKTSQKVEGSKNEQAIVLLASRQLEAYNRADLDAFCACYHPEVIVYDDQGQMSLQGAKAFRARYAPMFAQGKFGASVPERIAMGEHCIDRELYWREAVEGREAAQGEVLVRYRLKENLIGEVQFFH